MEKKKNLYEDLIMEENYNKGEVIKFFITF